MDTQVGQQDTAAAWRILLVEDSADDAELIGFALRNAPAGFSMKRVETEPDFVSALEAGPPPDVILCDYHLPRFDMTRALAIVREERRLEIPFIVVSRLIGEDAAVEAMQRGANDYLLKGRLGRLPAAIAAAIERNRSRQQRAVAEAALRRSDLLNRSLLQSLSMRIAVLDAQGAVIASNRAWQRSHGTEAPANYLDFLAREGRAVVAAGEIRAGIQAVVERRAPRFALEYELPARTGTRWEMVRAEPLEDSERGAVVSVEDITPRMLSHLALHDAHRRLRMLSRRVLAVQEEERRAIALELHDDIGQSLAALKIALHRLGAAEGPSVAECLAIAESTLERLRRLSYSLRPPQLDQFGLEGALRELARMQHEATGVAVECRLEAHSRRAPPPVEAACYRIVQEALNNATRHSRANRVDVELDVGERTMRVAVRDNGCGFDEAEAGARSLRTGSLGLIGMAERAELAGGRLKVRSVQGEGTVVAATFPLDVPPSAEGSRPVEAP